MTSRERVISTISHREPDRVPVGEWGIDHDHVEKILGKEVSMWRNRRLQTLSLWDNRRDEMVEQMIGDYDELIQALDYDLITVEMVPEKGRVIENSPKPVTPGIWEDDGGIRYKYTSSNDSIVQITHAPGKETLSDDDLNRAAEALARPFDPSRFELIDYFNEKYDGEKALVSRNINVFDILVDPFGGDFSHQLILPMTHPEEIRKLYPYALDRQKRLIGELKKRNVLIAMQGKDFCMNSGPMFTVDSLRDVLFPFQKLVTAELEKAGIHPFLHCCGNTWEILDDFIEAGWTGYQSVQKSAGMDWRKLKAEYGDKLTIWAGVSCETLIEGSRNDVEEEVSEALESLAPGGGFIFGSTNTVQYGADTDNYLQALEIARRFKY